MREKNAKKPPALRPVFAFLVVAAVIAVALAIGSGPALRFVFAPTKTDVEQGRSADDMRASGNVPTGPADAMGRPPEPITVVAEGLDVPWEIAFLPGGDMLVTERPGTLRRIGAKPGLIAIEGGLEVGEGGVMGLALHPDFAKNGLLYVYFTARRAGEFVNRVVRYEYGGTSLKNPKIIIDGIPAAVYHDGGRIAFGPDGKLYLTAGDATDSALAQDKTSLAGKTLRLNPDGSIPDDNPFGTAVWSYGHRNSQGMTWDDQGRMWQTEHGRSGISSGYDELNLVEKGKNYGWPSVQGDEQREGMTPPVRHSGPDDTWAPAGAAFLDGSVYFAGLRGESLYEARLAPDGSVTSLRAHLRKDYGRLRAVVAGPDGMLYVSTSNTDGRGRVREGDDKILRIDPAAFK